MEPFFLLALAAIGTLIMLLVSIAIFQLRQISKTQVDQSILIAELRALLLGVNGTPGLVSRVNDLHAWRNKMQEKELDDVHSELDRLNEERRQSGIPDRRHG